MTSTTPSTTSKLPQKPKLILAQEIQPRSMTWLWPPYIPNASASLIFGPGGSGKSHIAVEIAAALSRGDPLPGFDVPRDPMKILMLSAEDDFDLVLVPRLMAAGANLTNIGFPPEPFSLDKTGLRWVEEYIYEYDAAVTFIDPIVAYMGSKVDMNKANEVREVMGGLHQIAKKSGRAIIIIGHSRKGQEGEAFERAMGSVDFNNAVRSVLYTTRVPDGTRVLQHVKSNYSRLGPTLGYDFGDEGFEWTGVVEDPDDMAGAGFQTHGFASRPRQHAVQIMTRLLKVGPMPSSEVKQAVLDAGVNERTFERAKTEAGVESFMVWRAGKPVWYMRLHGDKTEIPSVDDGDENGTGRHTLVRPADGGEVHPTPAGGPSGDDRSVDAGGSGRGAAEPKPDAKAIAAAFLSRTAGGAQ